MLNKPQAGEGSELASAETQADERRRREGWRLASQVATVGIFVLLLGMVLSLARAVLLPVVTAIVVVVMLGPLARRATSYRVPPVLFAGLVVGLILAGANLVASALSGPVAKLISSAPELGPAIAAKFATLNPFFTALRNLQSMIGAGDSGLNVDIAAILQTTVAYLTPAIGQLVVFLATLFLALVSRDSLRRHLILIFPEQDDRLAVIQILNDIESKLTQYIGTVTSINFVVGLATAFVAWAAGLPAPILFGLLAFICNFVPYIGPGITLVSLLAGGLVVSASLSQALVAPALFLALATVEGQVITPSLIGHSIIISPLGAFLSLVFWMWLWGPVGGFLSVPLLIIGLTVLARAVPRTTVELPG